MTYSSTTYSFSSSKTFGNIRRVRENDEPGFGVEDVGSHPLRPNKNRDQDIVQGRSQGAGWGPGLPPPSRINIEQTSLQIQAGLREKANFKKRR
ncbi:hypothetical protein QJS10_CPB20g00813 [Acorus calamus]|uniref:Uncharacterized protein n=1 Tax=Acorus calamus TaxID=4465 RepID=A0AAV9C9N9_ACOCL|nr:hypothetical protein QJS10_CPB20g00813 [Acorus calamus]